MMKIEGMTCSHCAAAVEKAIKSAGAEHVTVNLVRGEALIKTNKNTDISGLIKAVHNAGYHAEKA